jgi:heptosyltransferase-1
MRILIVKTSSMGDIIHNLPIIRDIHSHFPKAIIDWVVEESFADIVKLHPEVTNIIPIAFRRWRKSLFTKSTKIDISSAITHLRENQYDYIIDTQGLIKSVLITLCARGPSYGRNWSSNREAFASLFYKRRFEVPFKQHTVARNRQLTALALNYPIPSKSPDYGLPCAELARLIDPALQLPKNYVLGLHATSRDSKLWPITNWVEIGQSLEKIGFSLLLPWSNNSEFERANVIAKQLKLSVVLPKLSIHALAEITAGAKAAIGVDTGLVHLAVALNIPSIAIYTDSEPTLNGALAAENQVAINLGGKGIIPSDGEVLGAFSSLNLATESSQSN